MRAAINEKAICNKNWMASGTNVNKLCIWRDVEERWKDLEGVRAIYADEGGPPSFFYPNLITTEERTR